jgi:hypothetical protein
MQSRPQLEQERTSRGDDGTDVDDPKLPNRHVCFCTTALRQLKMWAADMSGGDVVRDFRSGCFSVEALRFVALNALLQ